MRRPAPFARNSATAGRNILRFHSRCGNGWMMAMGFTDAHSLRIGCSGPEGCHHGCTPSVTTTIRRRPDGSSSSRGSRAPETGDAPCSVGADWPPTRPKARYHVRISRKAPSCSHSNRNSRINALHSAIESPASITSDRSKAGSCAGVRTGSQIRCSAPRSAVASSSNVSRPAEATRRRNGRRARPSDKGSSNCGLAATCTGTRPVLGEVAGSATCRRTSSIRVRGFTVALGG